MKIHVGFLNAVKGKSDLLVVGSFQGSDTPPKELKQLDPEAFETVKKAFTKKRFTGKAGQSFSVYGDFRRTEELILAGLGKKEEWSSVKLRKAIAEVLNRAKAQGAKSLFISADTFFGGSVHLDRASELIPETLELANYKFNKYLTKDKEELKKEPPVTTLLFADASKRNLLERSLERAGIISEAVNFTRDLINEPANVMPPREMAKQARLVARAGKLRCQVLGPAEIKKNKMGGIIAVSQGSSEPPQLIVLEYGAQHKSKGTLCLVGKGVTFDTGGISIKPSKDMEKMKYDMSGAAAVIGTLKAVSRLRPALHIVAIAPCVENMPSGTAQRPGDIIKMHNGKSVEVINTDAEGRLILGDALSYAERFKPKAIIDLATLTGAVVVCLADKAIGLMSTDHALAEKIRKAGEAVGDRCWELPLWEEFFDLIKGHHSDILNAGPGYGGTITAAMFLKEFAPIKSWAHLDIAGTAWVDSAKPYNARGATGVGVRLLLELIRNWK